MTRRIILAVIFTAVLGTNFSFTSPHPVKATSAPTVDRKFIIVCLYTGGCRYCGGVQWNSTSTTICASAACPGVYASICVTFASKVNAKSGKYEVDESTLDVTYSDPAVKAVTDEAALKADFIQQVNSQL